MVYIVALTGGIACGKSTVSNLFAKLGVPVVDADIISRQLVEKKSEILDALVHHFGQQILLADGALNRMKLREIIFNNEQQRQWLNQLLHPLIAQKTQQQFAQIHYPYVLWVVPLLIENNLHKQANRVLVIDCHSDMQLARIMHRDNIDENLAKKMLSSQISNKERLTHADDVIINNSQPIKLGLAVEQLHNKYLSLAANAPK